MKITPVEYERLKTMFYHVVDTETQQLMTEVRTRYVFLALDILRLASPSRSQSLALTHLEDSLMREIQAIALRGTPVLPPGFEVEA